MASKTIALRTELARLLRTQADYVYYEEAPDKRNFPYVVFELSEVLHSYGKTTFQLEINVIGHGEASSTIENLSDTIQTMLNKYFFINSDVEFTVYQGIRQIVKEDDKQIIRRRMLFEVQLHELKGEQ